MDSAELEDKWERQWQEAVLLRVMDELRREQGDSAAFRAFERYGLGGAAAADVAAELGLSEASVYQAKTRLLRVVRERVAAIREEEG